MFTGLIQGLGTIKHLGDEQLKISCSTSVLELIWRDLAIGDSVAVDGVCLTVVDILSQGFIAIASPETLSRTTLISLEDAHVNLETSLRVGSKIGGHFVSGHVDSCGCLQESVQTASSWEMTFTAPPKNTLLWQRQIAPYIVPKGSIAVNGISLTIAECDLAGSWFKVAVVPHTFNHTNLQYLVPGSWVNLESDILAKYVAKFVLSGFGSPKKWESELIPSPEMKTPESEEPSSVSSPDNITLAFLTEHGFM